MSIIKVNNLTKLYQINNKSKGFKEAIKKFYKKDVLTKIAVENITFEINEGEIVGFLGPNGAGKSTTIKMLSGILVPTSGQVLVNGLVPYKNRIENAKKIGVVFGQRTQLWWDIPLIESINLMRYMYNIPKETFFERLEFFNDLLNLNEFSFIPVKQLSLGQRMRADLCCALLHNPSIVFLDEPTVGLDIVVKKKIYDFLIEYNRQNKVTIILTTHDMNEIERLCNRVIVIDKGNKIYDGDLISLKENFGNDSEILFSLRDDLKIESLNTVFSKLLIENFIYENGYLTVNYKKSKISQIEIIMELIKICNITDIQIKDYSIEETVSQLYLSRKEKN
jgi:ABC-2 type transport system ATP-binding protein